MRLFLAGSARDNFDKTMGVIEYAKQKFVLFKRGFMDDESARKREIGYFSGHGFRQEGGG